MSTAKRHPQPKPPSGDSVWENEVFVGGLIFVMAFIIVTIIVTVACLVVAARRERIRHEQLMLNTEDQRVASGSVPKGRELGGKQVPSNVKGVVSKEFEIRSVYPSADLDNPPLSKGLEKRIPISDAIGERYSSSSSQKKRSETRLGPSVRHTEKGELYIDPKTDSMTIVPVYQHLLVSTRPASDNKKQPSSTSTASERSLEKGGLDPNTAHSALCLEDQHPNFTA